MTELVFVDKSTVRVTKQLTSDEDVLHAAWVSNFGDTERDPERTRPGQWHWRDGDWDEVKGEYGPDEVAQAWDKKAGGLINFLYGNKHMSPFEHNWMTFYIETPLFVAREFMRHRTWSYNEMSGRYTELPGRMFLIDSERPIVQQGKIGAYNFSGGTAEQYGLVFAETSLAYQNAWNAYQKMLGAGIAKEVARNVLPVGTMTQFYASANVRNIMQFLLLRNDQHALKEIRDVAVEIEAAFAKAMPLTYAAFKKYDWRNTADDLAAKDAQIAALEEQVAELRRRSL